jgi:hypothetical protein
VRTTSLVGLYPRAWRDRYGDELESILDEDGLGLRTRLDLVRGAVDAHLHPSVPSPLPVVAALTASAFAVAHAFALGAQPVQTDWPGYLEDGLPLIIARVLALIPVVVGLWLKLGDTDGALGRIGVVVAVVGHLAWLLALLAAATRVAYGPLTAAAATLAMAGTAALGIALVGRSRFVLGALLAAAALAGVAPPGLGWLAFAGAWTAVAVALVIDFLRTADSPGGPRVGQ